MQRLHLRRKGGRQVLGEEPAVGAVLRVEEVGGFFAGLQVDEGEGAELGPVSEVAEIDGVGGEVPAEELAEEVTGDPPEKGRRRLESCQRHRNVEG